MSDIGFTACFGPIAATSTAKTHAGLMAAAAIGITLVELEISFDSVTSPTALTLVELIRLTAAGTSAATPPTAIPRSPQSTAANAITSGVTVVHNLSAEPASAQVLRWWYLRQDLGAPWTRQFPLGREPMAAAAAQGIGVRITAPAGAGTANTRINLDWDE